MTDFAKVREAAAAKVAQELQTILNDAVKYESGSFFVTPLVDAALSAFEEAGLVLMPKTLDEETYRDFDYACALYLNTSGNEIDAANKAWNGLLEALKHKDQK